MQTVVKQVVADLLSEGAKHRGIMCNGQFSNRTTRSAITAAAMMSVTNGSGPLIQVWVRVETEQMHEWSSGL